jgi:hypothetical protein
LKPSTWNSYQRCMREMVLFMRRSGIIIFPVQEIYHARGMCLFFEHLRNTGTSWAKMAHFRSAIASASRSRDLPDPWKEWPRLQELTTGLSKEMKTPVVRKEGVTIIMVLALLKHLESEERYWRNLGRHSRADTALRRQGEIIVAFVGMRRGAECWLNESGGMGLRGGDIDLIAPSHVVLFVQSMKNDPTAKGTEVVLAWETSSGIRVGETLTRLLLRLRQCNIDLHGPLFCGTSHKGHGGFVKPAVGKAFREADILKTLLPRIYVECYRGSILLSRFSFHSFRRGGASWAFRVGAEFILVKGHGAWRSDAGVAPYMHANLDGKLSVTLAM